MRIALNVCCLAVGNETIISLYARQILEHLVGQYPQHQFILLSDRPLHDSPIKGNHVSSEIIAPSIKSGVSRKIWYNVKLPAAIRKHKADVLVHFDSIASSTINIPQILIAKDLANLHNIRESKKARLLLYKLSQGKVFSKAKRIAVFSEHIQQEIIEEYKIPTDRFSLVHPFAKEIFRPLAFAEKESVKDGFADGREYFLFVEDATLNSNLMDVLKAFSQFKKWQRSSMKLLIAGKLDPSFQEKLTSYKYRDDVELLDILPEEQAARVTGAAYAFIGVPSYTGFSLPVLQAMQSGVPVIISNIPTLEEIAGTSALYATVNDVDEIANHMKTIYRDEKLRNQLVQGGLNEAKRFSPEKSLQQFYACIETAASS